MKGRLLATTALGLLATFAVGATNVQAAPVTFSGQDAGNGSGTPLASHPNSDAARTNFLSNLTNDVQTNGMDDPSIHAGDTAPSIAFADGVTATLAGGTIFDTPDSNGYFAISNPNYYGVYSDGFTIQFSSPIAAFGFYGVDIGDFGGTLTLKATNGPTETDLTVPSLSGSGGSGAANGSVLYFGFYDTGQTYTEITFQNSVASDFFAFDDFLVGTSQQIKSVPEPASATLLASGLTGIAALRRRRKRRRP
jgi:PEP-CTERM motif